MKSLTLNLCLSVLGIIVYGLLAIGSYGTDQLSDDPKEKLEFVGRVSDTLKNPKNNRLVIAYLNGKEVGRSQTELGKYDGIDKNPDDGLFILEVDNSYELTETELHSSAGVRPSSLGSKSSTSSLMEQKLWSRTYMNIGELNEGDWFNLNVKSRRNLSYSLKVLPGEIESLPLDLQNGDNPTVLTKDHEVVVVTNQGVPKQKVTDVVFTKETEEVKIKEIEFPINNCGGSSIAKQRYEKTESFLHEKSFNLNARVKARFPALWLLGIDLSPQLQMKYGFVEREFSEETIAVEFKSEPRTSTTYTIAWYEVWQHGVAKVESTEGIVSVPFKVKTKLKYEINSTKGRCN
ncbi:MAG: hypothetical protein AAFP89_27115 [Bacteroidota bacterium]